MFDPSTMKALADWGLSPVWAVLIWVIHRLGQLIGAALIRIHGTLTRLEEKLEGHINATKKHEDQDRRKE